MAARVLIAVAVVAILAIVVLYVSLIKSQGEQDPVSALVVPFIVGYLLVMAILLATSLVVAPAARPGLRGAASAGLLVLGWLAAFSIGVAVLIAAGLAIAATVLAINARPGAGSIASVAGAGLIAVLVLVAGFEFAWQHPVCPPNGEGGGSIPSLIGHGSSYECNGGVLTLH